MSATNKLKILNDPIYGFITLPSAQIFDLLEHPYFQRLRRIAQLGLTYLVYPGAYHTRFHHALGAMHLMQRAVQTLRAKSQTISHSEEEALYQAILLHDIGHGPFSHALENSLVPGLSHETISRYFMARLNEEFSGALETALALFEKRYPRQFLQQLISSQLDVDRLDYLRRDCFYTGVSEGRVNTERLISMLNVAEDELVVDSKGIYSVEKFLVARRLMYWQVYLHKTVLSAEYLLIQILRRARRVYRPGMNCPEVLRPFLASNLPKEPKILVGLYAQLDDHDLMAAIKSWSNAKDRLLAHLCQRVLHRRLLGVRIFNTPLSGDGIRNLRKKLCRDEGWSEEEAEHLVFTEEISNNAYDPHQDRIRLLYRNGDLLDITEAADHLNLSALSKPVIKHFLFAPKHLLPA